MLIFTALRITEREEYHIQVFFLYAWLHMLSLSLSSIGGILDKDHTTVLHAIRNHALNCSQDTLYQTIYNQIYDQLSARMDKFNDGINKVLSEKE